MKKTFLALAICSFSLLSFAQPSADVNEFPNDSTIKEVTSSHDRISKLETEVKELKASNAVIQKQLVDIKNLLPVSKKKKLEVNRVGSKQPVWVEE